MPEGQIQTDDQYFAVLAGAGVTVFVSSGDGGSIPGSNGAMDDSVPGAFGPSNERRALAMGAWLKTLPRPLALFAANDLWGHELLQAAREAGYQGDLEGKSVTALEIEFGVLDSGEQPKLGRFYFRQPLPYSQMDPATAAQVCP